jgi:hypothetical protein
LQFAVARRGRDGSARGSIKLHQKLQAIARQALKLGRCIQFRCTRLTQSQSVQTSVSPQFDAQGAG